MSYLIKKRQFVTPGDLLAEGNYKPGENTFKEGKKIYSTMIGLSNDIGRNVFVVALNGCYIPRVGDYVIGKIIALRLGSWIVDITSPYNAILFTSEVVDRPFNSRKEEMTRIIVLCIGGIGMVFFGSSISAAAGAPFGACGLDHLERRRGIPP